MANETTTTTTTGLIHTSMINKVLLSYALEHNVFIPRVRAQKVSGEGTATAAFAVATKASAAAITEATGMSNTAATFANTTVAVSEVGILRQITKRASRLGMLGEAGLDAWAIEDGSKLCLEKMETDALAVVTNASTSVGTTGAKLTIGNIAGAVSQAAINKARGTGFFVVTEFQARDAREAIASSAATILQAIGGASLMNRPDSTGYLGNIMGQDVYQSSLAPTASSDKVGVYAIDGYMHPENAPVGMAFGWMPEVESVATPALPGKQLAVTACYGFGEISDFNYVKIVTIGS